MKTSEMFDGLLENLKVGDTAEIIAARRDEITKALNKEFRSKDGCTDYKLMVGSFGRHTAIKNISDLDMIFILPPGLSDVYSSETGPRRILERVRDALKRRYPNTDIAVDQCVVRVQFVRSAFKFEVQPAFENGDGSFEYPDTFEKCWKTTKPREEIQATKECNDRTSKNMRYLARMIRAWKNTSGVNMGGLLIDTLVHRFFAKNSMYDTAGTASFDVMVRDFFEFLKDEPTQDYYCALGSGQRVKVKANFQFKAKKAHSHCCQAIENQGTIQEFAKWREVFGTSVPLEPNSKTARSVFQNTEEFIEDVSPVDISETVKIDCEVTQDGWRPTLLRKMLSTGAPLRVGKSLKFWIVNCTVLEPYDVKWKVLNRGEEAERRDMIRGQIVSSTRKQYRTETSNFKGSHFVECYIIKDGVVVARDYIDVPISSPNADI